MTNMGVVEIILKTTGLGGLIITIGAYLISGNRKFFKLVDEFHEKLPPKHKQAQSSFDNQLSFTIVDVSSMKMNLSTEEIDVFHKRLENFKYETIIFKREQIQSYSQNLQRLLRGGKSEKFNIAVIQKLLEEEPFASRKPYLFGNTIGKIIGF